MEMSHHIPFSQGTDIVAEQLSDPNLSRVNAWIQKNKRPYLKHLKGNTLWKFWWQFPKPLLCNDLLCQTAQTALGKPVVFQVLIPISLIKDPMNNLHGNPCSGHYSADHTFKKALCAIGQT